MTIAFFVILLLNCFVIFAADALLGGSLENLNNSSSVLVIKATTANSALIDSLNSIGDLYSAKIAQGGSESVEYAEGNSFKVTQHNDGVKRTVARKGAPIFVESSSPNSTLTPTTLDKIPTSSATIASSFASNQNKSIADISPMHSKLPTPLPFPSSSSNSDAGKMVNNILAKLTGQTNSTKDDTPVASDSSSRSNNNNTTAKIVATTKKTTTTTTTTTTTSTTEKPRKPSITYSVEDNSKLLEVPVQSLPIIAGGKAMQVHEDLPHSDRSQLVIPLIALIFAVPMVLGMVTVFTRRFKHYWSTRHYRRMDFLVDGMYNT